MIIRNPLYRRRVSIGSDLVKTYDTPISIAKSLHKYQQTHKDTKNNNTTHHKHNGSKTFGNFRKEKVKHQIQPKKTPSVIHKSNKSTTKTTKSQKHVNKGIYIHNVIKSVPSVDMRIKETRISTTKPETKLAKKHTETKSMRSSTNNTPITHTHTILTINQHMTYRQKLEKMAKEEIGEVGIESRSSIPVSFVGDSNKAEVKGLPKSVSKSVASVVEKELSHSKSSEQTKPDITPPQNTQSQIGTKTQVLLKSSKSMKNAKSVKERREIKEELSKQLSSESKPSTLPKGMPSPHLVTGSGKSEIITTPSGTSLKSGEKAKESGKHVKGVNMNATVPNSVKEKVYKEVKRWLHSLPEWVQDKVDADSLVETIRLASTYGELMRTVNMINSTVKAVVLNRAKERALKYMESLPSNIKEILSTTGGIYDEYIKKIKGAKSVEELNRIMEEFVREANDYIKSAYARVMNWQKRREGSILLKWEQYKDFELNKEKILKWLESLPEQVKNAMGKKYKEVEEQVRSATSYKELKEAVKEANEQVKEAWLKAETLQRRGLEMLYPELSRSIIAKFEQYKDFESAKEKVIDYLMSLPEQVKSSLDITKLEQEVRKAKDWKELENMVKDINEQVKEAYRNAVKGEIMHVKAIATTIPSSIHIGHVSKGTKEVISEKSREEIKDWINKVGDTLIKAGVWNEFFDRYGKYVKELKSTNNPKRAKELIEKIRKGAEQVLLKHYKSKIISDLEKYKKELKPYERTVIGNTIDEFVNAVRRAKDLDQLRDVVKKYKKELLEDAVIVGRGLKNLEFPNFAKFPTAPQNIGIGEEEAISLAGSVVSSPDMTSISLNPQEWQEGTMELFKAFHPTSLSDAIAREAYKENNPWMQGLGGFLSGFIGATVGMFNPENYYDMYKLITNPEYRSEYFKEMGELKDKKSALFWGNVIGNIAGIVAMGALGKVAGGKELAIQEFEPILQIRRGNLAKGSITEIGYWKTLAKLPKDEVLEFGKGGMFMKGSEGGFSIESFKTPTMEEVKFGVKGIELPKETWSSSVNLGKVGSVEMKWILPKMGEPIATEIKGFEISSTPETVKFSAIEAGKPTGILGKTIGGKVFRYAEVEGEVPYDFYRSFEMSGWKIGKLGITRAKWGEFEGKLPTFEVEFGGKGGFKGIKVTPSESETGSTISGIEEGGVEIPIEGVEKTGVGTKTPEANIPIHYTSESAEDIVKELRTLEGDVGRGGRGIEAREGKGEVVELVEKSEVKGEVGKGKMSMIPKIRIVEEPSWISSIELIVPSSIAGINSMVVNIKGSGKMKSISKDITKLMKDVELKGNGINEIITEAENIGKGIGRFKEFSLPIITFKGLTIGSWGEKSEIPFMLVEPITYKFEMPPIITPKAFMFEHINIGNMMSPVPMEMGKTVKVPFEAPQTPKVEGFRYEPRFKYVTPSIETSPATLSLNTPSVSTLDTASQSEGTITPPPEDIGDGIGDINIQGILPITQSSPNILPSPNNPPNTQNIPINTPTRWSPKLKSPTWWYPLWWRRRYGRRPRYVLEVLTI